MTYAASVMTISNSGRADPRKAASYVRVEFRNPIAEPEPACAPIPLPRQFFIALGAWRSRFCVFRNGRRERLAALRRVRQGFADKRHESLAAAGILDALRSYLRCAVECPKGTNQLRMIANRF